jgi:hypothetical protein
VSSLTEVIFANRAPAVENINLIPMGSNSPNEKASLGLIAEAVTQ